MLIMARTLMGNPDLLLLDEPSEGLAPLVVEALLVKIGALKAQGTTILLAEQGVDFSLALADCVYVLEKGEVRYTGSAAALRSDRALLDRLITLWGPPRRGEPSRSRRRERRSTKVGTGLQTERLCSAGHLERMPEHVQRCRYIGNRRPQQPRTRKSSPSARPRGKRRPAVY